METRIALHFHSHFSDGQYSVEDCVKRLLFEQKQFGGSKTIASLTDHDTFSGIQSFLTLAERNGIISIPGIEITAAEELPEPIKGHPDILMMQKRFIHILGYWSLEDYHIRDPAKGMKEKLDITKQYRWERAKGIILDLQNANFPVTLRELEDYVDCGIPTRIHIAALLFNKGYGESILDARKMIVNKFASNVDLPLFFKIGNVEEKIEMILDYGGIPVLPHGNELPQYYQKNLDATLIEFKKFGLRGGEIKENYSPLMMEHFMRFLISNGLLITSGRDWHGEKFKPQIEKVSMIDYIGVEESLYEHHLIR